MDIYDKIESRFHFKVPQDYKRFWRAGLLVNQGTSGLRVSHFFWLSPEEIANREFPNYKIKGLVHCARTFGGGHYCWYMEHASNDQWIADCPRDSDFADGYAPSFEGFVFRAILEEFANSWLDLPVSEIADLYRNYPLRASIAMRPEWVNILARFASRTPRLSNANQAYIISKEELTNVISIELAFPYLNKSFKQHTDM